MDNGESITVSLEMARKLQAAGWAQGWTGVGTLQSFSEKPETMVASITGGYFKWFDVRSDYTKGDPSPEVHSIYCNYPMIAEAPTATEILAALPKEHANRFWLTIEPSSDSDRWCVAYREPGVGDKKNFEASTLADAAAMMWIFLNS